jgi:hypothetical protein
MNLCQKAQAGWGSPNRSIFLPVVSGDPVVKPEDSSGLGQVAGGYTPDHDALGGVGCLKSERGVE